MIELLALLVGLYLIQLYAHYQEREKWRQERSELLTRIQHPEIVIPTREPKDDPEPQDQGELHLVGRIVGDQ